MASRVFQGAEQSTAGYCMLDLRNIVLARVCVGRLHGHSRLARPWAGPRSCQSSRQRCEPQWCSARVQEELQSEASEAD